MKKLLFLLLLLLVFGTLEGQSSAKNSLSVTAGPNWFFQFSEQIDTRFTAKTGFTAGLDYARTITPRWQLWALGRYNIWRSLIHKENLRWGSEYGPGGVWMPDPNLPHSAEIDVTDKTWQLMAGIRYSGKPGLWRWYTDVGAGITDYIEHGNSDAPLRFAVGIGAGIEWLPSTRHFGIFIQPGGRYIFKISPEHVVDFHFLIFSLETGARWHF